VFPYIDADPAMLPSSIDPFTITTHTGFMPFQTPIVELPPAFKVLTKLCDDMPIVKLDGTPGLLASYQLGPTVDGVKPLPDLTDEIDSLVAADGKPDLVMVTAIFRDYAFLASAYLLEPCWERWNKGLEGYGLGRQVLPACIARPLVKTAKL
jgi:indoleamine 2,3-dioxygenase